VNLTEAGQYFPDQRIGGANVWHILLDPSWLHEQAAVGLRCRRLLELLKPSGPVSHLLRPRDVLFLPIVRAQSRMSGTPPSSSARHASDCGAHQQLVDPLTTRLMLGSAAFTLAMSARATSSSAGVGRMAPIVAATPRLRWATTSWRNSACGLYIGTIRSTPVRGLRKGSSFSGLILKASMVGFTSSRALTTICVDKVPAPRSRPTTVRQGNGGLI
jgi:hypothetical protein